MWRCSQWCGGLPVFPCVYICTLSIQTLKICRVQSETSGIGDFGEIPRVYIGNLGFYHYLEIFGVLLNLRSLCKYNQWFRNYLSDSAKKVRVWIFWKAVPVSYPYPTRINPVFTRIFSSKPWVWNENPGFSLPVSYPYPTRINPVFSRIENMGPYTLSQNGERLAESGIYWYFTQTINHWISWILKTSGFLLKPRVSKWTLRFCRVRKPRVYIIRGWSSTQ